MNYVKLGDTFILPFATTNPTTGTALAADVLPTVAVVAAPTLLGYAPTVTSLGGGLYYATVVATTLNGFAVGNACAAWVTATVAGVTASDGIGAFKVATASVDTLNTAVAAVAATVNAQVAATTTAILDAMLTNHTLVGSVGDAIAVTAGLLQGNFYMDQTNNSNPNGQTSARIRLFRTNVATAAATSGGSGQGEFATYTVTTTYVGLNKVATHKVVRL